jgi:hypothetical protein
MSKVIWGKHVWKALHYIALGYPNNPTNEQKEDYKTFYLLLKTVLPCKICRDHYVDNLINLPLNDDALKDKDSLIKWSINLHNLINQQLGNPILSYENALNELKSYETCHLNTSNNYNYNYLILLFITILLIIYLYKK